MTGHWEVLLIPVLMLVDYFLTVVGARLAEGGYRRHFKFPDYELNPVLRKAIAAKKWLSPRHLLAVVLVGAVCGLWYQWWQEEEPLFEMFLGGAYGLFAAVIGGHVANIWSFYYLLKHPEKVSGEVVMTQRYVRHVTRARMLMVLLPAGGVVYFVPSPFVVGVVGGVGALMWALTVWMWREGRRDRVRR
jgi:hypothetical protein